MKAVSKRKRPLVEDMLARLSELRSEPAAPGAQQELAKYLGSKINLLVAKAAGIAGDFRITDLIPNLVDAFHRFLVHPAVSDKGCAAKTEIVKALCAMEHACPEIFLLGVHHVQMEGSFGPPVDTAAELRGVSAMALVATGHPDALLEAVSLLVDREAAARAGAVRAIAHSGRPEAALLLRLKVLTGDREAGVLAECFTGLLALEPLRSLAFVAGYLDHDAPAIGEAAAMALGESRQEAALEILKARLQKPAIPQLRRALLLSIAMLRREPALQFLLELAAADKSTAADAIAALELYKHDEKVQQKLREMHLVRP